MFHTLLILPLPFWVTTVLLFAGISWAGSRIRQGIGLPVIAVLGTITVWYVGDAFYNDYAENHAKTFPVEILSVAWWQVALFLVSFLILVPWVHGYLNAHFASRWSQSYSLFIRGVGNPDFQNQIQQIFWACFVVWLVLVLLAVIKLGDQTIYFFFPFLRYRADPWARGRIGGGIDALLSLAGYFQIFIATAFGLVLATVVNQKVRSFAFILCLLTWPYFLFDRTRNIMLAVVVPGILAWAFFRLRGTVLKKILVLIISFLIINVWFEFVIANRSNMAITEAIKTESLKQSVDVRHEGLNMFEELCWIDFLIREGSYTPNWGQRYFAEMVNPIPRALWPGKPMIGIDYASARGQSVQQGADTDESGVYATVSTGMIGQGVVNFGRWLGPIFAAFLLSIWAGVLARLDLTGDKIGRIPLFALGIILTFNLGRDITFITLYTFVFGSLLVWWIGRKTCTLPAKQTSPATLPTSSRRRRNLRERHGLNAEPRSVGQKYPDPRPENKS